MQRHTEHALAYYTFENLTRPGLVHGISTRQGGVSPPPFDTLNLGSTVGDTPSNVLTNVRRWHTALGLESTNTVTAAQAHSHQAAIAYACDRGTRIAGVDALLTDTPGLALLLRFADCVPILLFDPDRPAVGLVHSGWKGTVLKVLTAAVRRMQEAFGSIPAHIIAAIGPSIGPCCYSVGMDVAERASKAYQGYPVLLERGGRTYFDLWTANVVQLRELGIQQIELAAICTADHIDDFYSARISRPSCGRFGAIIGLT